MLVLYTLDKGTNFLSEMSGETNQLELLILY